MKVGFHAPPAGTHSGVADYAQGLLGALQHLGKVESDSDRADIHLYHLGNNRLHCEIYRRALEQPGIAVLHDAVLHHFMLGVMSREQYLAEFVYNYGEWQRDLGEELWRDSRNSSVDPRYFRFPMLRRIIERSRAVVVHNLGAETIVRGHGARTVHVIPHFYEPEPAPEASEKIRFRQTSGIDPGATTFGIFGYLRESKRVLPCIAAFKRLYARRRGTALLVSGECVSPDLNRALAAEPGSPGIHRIGRLTDSELVLALSSVDCVLNLRYPGAGETSGIAIRAMGLGRPVIVSDNAENADFPLHAVLRVRPGVAEISELFDHMSLVTEFPAVAQDIGKRAQGHIQISHRLESVARKYWEVLCAVQ